MKIDQNLDSALFALAVLGSADCETVAAVLDVPVDDPVIAYLASDEAVQFEQNQLALAPDVAALSLEAQEASNPLHFRATHFRALELLVQRLDQNGQLAESQFFQVFTRLAEHLRQQSVVDLPRLSELVRDIPLREEQHKHYRRFIDGLALLQMEHFSDSIELCNDLLSTPALSLELRGRIHSLRATCQYYLGNYQEAFDDYHAGMEALLESDNQLGAGIVHYNMGMLAYDLRDYSQATAHLDQAKQIFVMQDSDVWQAAVQNELGLVYRDLGKWKQALDYFREFLRYSESIHAQQDVAIGLLNMGEVLLLQGQYAEAGVQLRAALAMMSTDAFRIDVLLGLGLIDQVQTQYESAEAKYRSALHLADTLGRRYAQASIYYRLADVSRIKQDVESALSYLHKGIRIVEATRTPLRDESTKITLLGSWQNLYETAILLSLDQRSIGSAYNIAARARGRAFLEMIATSSHDGIAVNTFADEMPADVESIQSVLSPEAALVEFFATGLPGAYAGMVANAPPEAAALYRCLLPPERLLAFIVTKTTVHAMFLNANLRQIQGQHFQRRDGRLRGISPLPGTQLPPLRRWQTLANQILQPLTAFVSGKRHLYFVPYGILHYLPLHALISPDQLTGNSGTTVSYMPSGSILYNSLAETYAPDPSVARNPSTLTVGVDTDGLSHAEAEAAWIARRLHGKALLGDAATAQRIIEVSPQHQVIHFSCHGHFRRRTPMQSALQLAQESELTAADVLNSMNLQADLITLSACDTGLNQLHPGEELMGFTRAFLGRGARSMIVSLWPVQEIPTRIFMERFYDSWYEGVSKGEAFVAAQRYVADMDVKVLGQVLETYGLSRAEQRAMLELFQTMVPGTQPFNHPYYWGGFLLIGDPR